MLRSSDFFLQSGYFLFLFFYKGDLLLGSNASATVGIIGYAKCFTCIPRKNITKNIELFFCAYVNKYLLDNYTEYNYHDKNMQHHIN